MQYTSEDTSHRFLEHAWMSHHGAVKLFGTRCTQCDHRFFPEKSVCPTCGGEDSLERVELAPKGSSVQLHRSACGPSRICNALHRRVCRS